MLDTLSRLTGLEEHVAGPETYPTKRAVIGSCVGFWLSGNRTGRRQLWSSDNLDYLYDSSALELRKHKWICSKSVLHTYDLLRCSSSSGLRIGISDVY